MKPFPKPRCILPPNKVIGSVKDYNRKRDTSLSDEELEEITSPNVIRKGLVDGCIPKNTPCPFFSECTIRNSNCPSEVNCDLRDVPFSCGVARAFSLLSESIHN